MLILAIIVFILVAYFIHRDVNSLKKGQVSILATISDLQNKVAELTTVDQSVVALLDGLSAQLKAAQNDPAAIQKVIDDLDAQKASLADAVTRNTVPPPA